MSSGESHRSQGQFLQAQGALSGPSASSSAPSQPTAPGYCYPSAIIESLHTGSSTHRAISPTIVRSTLEFGPVTGQSDIAGQSQVSRNTPYSGETASSSLSSDPGPSLLQSTFPAQDRGDLLSSDFSGTGATVAPWYVIFIGIWRITAETWARQHAPVQHGFVSDCDGSRGLFIRANASEHKYGPSIFF